MNTEGLELILKYKIKEWHLQEVSNERRDTWVEELFQPLCRDGCYLVPCLCLSSYCMKPQTTWSAKRVKTNKEIKKYEEQGKARECGTLWHEARPMFHDAIDE
ncbi:hypothetical protein V8G54_021283 [Vigna mungo]|uniref:Uncharacterized protein n=1 Tax=Vigna mungo TaxID=3915 RepID=A0AAQ3RVJ4_VIGMU